MSLGIFRNTVLLVAVCMVLACNNSDDTVVDSRPKNSAGFCDLKIDDFVLGNQSTNLSAYDSFSEVIFKNQEGSTMIFTVGASVESRFEGIFEVNDTLNICYSTESVETKLTSPGGIEITFLTEPKAYFADLQDALYADVIKIYYNNKKDESIDRRIVFRKVLEMNSYPPPLYETTTTIGSQFFIDKEFKNIELTQFNTPIIQLYYHDTIGVVAFVDEQGVLWQFETKS